MKLTFIWIYLFRVLFPIPGFIPNSTFYLQFRVLVATSIAHAHNFLRFLHLNFEDDAGDATDWKLTTPGHLNCNNIMKHFLKTALLAKIVFLIVLPHSVKMEKDAEYCGPMNTEDPLCLLRKGILILFPVVVNWINYSHIKLVIFKPICVLYFKANLCSLLTRRKRGNTITNLRI